MKMLSDYMVTFCSKPILYCIALAKTRFEYASAMER